MDQELFQDVKAFLEKEKGCSNIESEVPIKEKSINPLLKPDAPWIAHDSFQPSRTNPKYQRIPNTVPKEVEETPMLRKIFQNWQRVKDSWTEDS